MLCSWVSAAKKSVKTLGNTNPATQQDIPEDLNLQQECCRTVISCIISQCWKLKEKRHSHKLECCFQTWRILQLVNKYRMCRKLQTVSASALKMHLCVHLCCFCEHSRFLTCLHVPTRAQQEYSFHKQVIIQTITPRHILCPNIWAWSSGDSFWLSYHIFLTSSFVTHSHSRPPLIHLNFNTLLSNRKYKLWCTPCNYFPLPC